MDSEKKERKVGVSEYPEVSEAGGDGLHSGASGPSAVAIGKFDGTHVGHRKLLEELCEVARENGLRTAVLLVGTGSAHVDEKEEQIRHLHELGVETVYELELTPEVRTMSARRFLEEILLGRLEMHYLVGGKDLSFGFQRQGNEAFLKENAPKYGFRYQLIDKISLDGISPEQKETVSSTLLHEELKKGNMESACRIMGRNYEISGPVQHGRHLGTECLQVPTINQEVDKNRCLPPNGVYVSRVRLPGEGAGKEMSDNQNTGICYGISNLGIGPSINGGNDPLRLETHLLNAPDGVDLYGKNVTTELLHFIRPEKKFESLEELRRQIHEADMAAARDYLNSSVYRKGAAAVNSN